MEPVYAAPSTSAPSGSLLPRIEAVASPQGQVEIGGAIAPPDMASLQPQPVTAEAAKPMLVSWSTDRAKSPLADLPEPVRALAPAESIGANAPAAGPIATVKVVRTVESQIPLALACRDSLCPQLSGQSHSPSPALPVAAADGLAEVAPDPELASAQPPAAISSPTAPDAHPPVWQQAQDPGLDPASPLSPEFPGPDDDGFLTPDASAQPLSSEDVEAELGDIQIIQPTLQPAPRRQPVVQLLLRSAAFTSSNVTASEANPDDDLLLINSATLLATPALGPETRLIAAVGGGLTSFADNSDLDYTFLSLNVGLQQRLGPGTYGQVAWLQERLFDADAGDRLLLDNSLQLIVGHQDQLAERLRLDYFYELRARFTEPEDRSRIGNAVGARLRYDVTPTLQAALDYRLTLTDYTQQDRFDTQHQIRAIATHNLSRTVFLSGSVSYTFGSSSNGAVDLSNFSAGLSVGFNVPLF